MSPRAATTELDRQIAATHQRFVKSMDERAVTMAPEMKETYFAILSRLVAKLETPGKPLKDVAQEMMAESMGEVLAMMQA